MTNIICMTNICLTNFWVFCSSLVSPIRFNALFAFPALKTLPPISLVSGWILKFFFFFSLCTFHWSICAMSFLPVQSDVHWSHHQQGTSLSSLNGLHESQYDDSSVNFLLLSRFPPFHFHFLLHITFTLSDICLCTSCLCSSPHWRCQPLRPHWTEKTWNKCFL